ncbi:GTPase/DUF3482 domain-containing protein [Saccharospirillum salsuginis]|uniref:GTP-binding protein n=1 Tax=Saccharospirillum salsuginis TaxID=418750 RepID=A0A918NDA9_9GAMM|nr:GTPase/DUF3482 domain-containing protein [Saccharospirillum salsuginis]GGX59489.1 GTP-binding protein [Saccharospirillum salsuginis]
MTGLDDYPVFAVVGHPNQGKSSVVSTLVQDDHIAISPVSGTTREAHRYRLMLGEQTLYELVDTPGFQRARQVLDWCASRSQGAADRPALLADFIDAHRHDSRFADDCALLQPILDGAGIVYVVDSSRPYSPAFEAELTLLSWTARPRLALLNPVGQSSHEVEWQSALNQYFSLVRTFNPLLAAFDQHLSLLRAMAEIHTPWRENLLRSVEALNEQRQQRHEQAADALVVYLQAVFRYRLQLPVTGGTKETLRKTGLTQYNRELQRREQSLQQQLAKLYGHTQLDWDSEWRALRTEDLTDAHEWRVWGLSRRRLASLSGAAGALSGLAVDAAVGGTSLLLGAVVGGTLGGLAGGFAGRDALSFQLISKVPGYEQWQLGPVSNLEFAVALVGRALRSWYQLRLRNHARRDALMVHTPDLAQWMDGLDRKQQVQLLFWLRKLMKRSVTPGEENQLKSLILALGEQMDKPDVKKI